MKRGKRQVENRLQPEECFVLVSRTQQHRTQPGELCRSGQPARPQKLDSRFLDPRKKLRGKYPASLVDPSELGQSSLGTQTQT